MAAYCPQCGTQVADDARFCAACGARQAEPGVSPAREVRKVVTILFADVTGSTALGEQLDPEALRALMTRYFVRVRGVIEGHGGTVEKFIGDAVMAVFGIPSVHEDDPLRAVRAAADIREAVAAMNAELEREHGLTVRFRTGVNTGEVIAGDPASGTTLVTGDTVNTAARLEQSAPPGEILMGRLTYSLVRDAVDAEPVDAIAAKGKAAPVEAWRLLAVHHGAEGRARHLDAPLVGRARELDKLAGAWRTAVDTRTAHLVTLVAPAGVGKSRLVREAIERVRADGGRVLVGRCLSYGEGITYWPVRELVIAAAGITEADDAPAARSKVDRLLDGAPDGERVARRIATMVGLSTEAAAQEELFWAVRRTLEHLAAAQPLLIVLEDLHWAEDTFLDLTDYLVDLAAPSAMLLLGTARPDLLEHRPGFGLGKDAASQLRLDPLGPDDAAALLAGLAGGSGVPDQIRTRILDAAEGNPLFVEEIIGLLRDDGRLSQTADGWHASPGIEHLAVPLSIKALLSARLEALPTAERVVAQRASVIGRSFEVAALADLDPALSDGLSRHLLGLVRKEMLRPDRAELTAGDAFRFRHVLIRDAAYEAIPKSERSGLHERFADWLARAAGDRMTELEPIVGYHLEQAHQLRRALGESGDSLDRLAARAAEWLRSAGVRASEHGDARAAIDLLERARTLWTLPSDAALVLARSLVKASSPERAVEVLEEAVMEASDATTHRRLMAGLLESRFWLTGTVDREAVTALDLAVEPGADPDPATEVEVWRVKSTLGWIDGDVEGSAIAMRHAMEYAKHAGFHDRAEEFEFELWLRAFVGETPFPDVIDAAEQLLARPDTSPIIEAPLRGSLAICFAITLDADRARQELAAAIAICEQLGLRMERARTLLDEAWVDRLLIGPGAEADRLAAFEGPPYLEGTAISRRLAALARAGRMREAEALIAERTTRGGRPGLRLVEDSMATIVDARLAAFRGDRESALTLVATALAQADRQRQLRNAYGDLLRDVGDVLYAVGDIDGARTRWRQALDVARAKGHLAAIRATEERLMDLDGTVAMG